jgi:hypothetical protein
MNMSIRLLGPALALAALCAAQGCTETTTPRSTWEHGESVHSVMQSQILNPQAGGDAPVQGMAGETAMRAAKRQEAMGEEKKASGVMEQMAEKLGGPPPAK